MRLKYLLSILILVLIGSTIVLATTTNQRYGFTDVYFNIPAIPLFNVTLPNNIGYVSSNTSTQTANEEFNTSTPNAYNLTVNVSGTSYRQNSTVIGDATNVTNFNITNIGSVTENITLCINASLSLKIALWATKTANPYDSSAPIPNCSAGAWIANSSLPMGNITQVWIWANFTGASYPTDSTARDLYINSTQSS